MSYLVAAIVGLIIAGPVGILLGPLAMLASIFAVQCLTALVLFLRVR